MPGRMESCLSRLLTILYPRRYEAIVTTDAIGRAPAAAAAQQISPLGQIITKFSVPPSQAQVVKMPAKKTQ